MLQISTGKFYGTTDRNNLYFTTHQGVFYTNYSGFLDKTTTCVGDLIPKEKCEEFQAIIAEVNECIPKPNRDPLPGDPIAVGGQTTMLPDFAALVSFGMNVTCTLDYNLAKRLITAQRPSLGIYALPRSYVLRMFDSSIPYRKEDFDILKSFITDLIGLERKHYEGVMRAIRRYVTAMHRLADDLDLAYALLVASIESLTQEFDNFNPNWEDLEERKRRRFDKALINATNEIRNNTQKAILEVEHVALKRRFCEFTINYLQSAYFREEAKNQQRAAGRTEIKIALKNAYDLRSSYIHTLKTLPKNLVQIPFFDDIQIVESRPLLTFNGLARVVRHVIMEFTKKSLKIEKEKFDYTSEYPGIVRVYLHSKYWIGDPERYSKDTSRQVLNGFLQQVTDCLVTSNREITDMRPIMVKIRKLVPSLAKDEQKMPMLTLIFIFSYFLPQNEQKEVLLFLEPYFDLFNRPTIDSFFANFMAHFFGNQAAPKWSQSLEQTDKILQKYITKRYEKKGLNPGSIIGAAMVLWVAEMHRLAGNDPRARELIAYSVEEFPQKKALYDFEKNLQNGSLPEINYKNILSLFLKNE